MTDTMQTLMEAIENRLYGTGITVTPREITKNNGVKLMAIGVSGGDMVEKMVYVDEILSMMEAGEMDEFEGAEEFEEIYRRTEAASYKEDAAEIIDILMSGDKDRILRNVKPALVNKEWNKETEERYAGDDFLDLVLQYKICAGNASARFPKESMETYGITQEEMRNAAERNAKDHGYKVISMDDIAKQTGVPVDWEAERIPMYVITNKENMDGASAMIFGELFEEIAQRMHTDIFVLPSSTDELIVIPACGVDTTSVKEMIKDVNKSLVDAKKRLSDHPYIYKRGSMAVAIA